jgi:GNAT superfamily N-acetyltransferase
MADSASSPLAVALTTISAENIFISIFYSGGRAMINEWKRGEYIISTDKSRLDLNIIHSFLTASYWAEGIPLETVQRAIEHSFTLGVYRADQQVGFARLVTDYTTFAYLADVFILEPFRNQGLSKWLLTVMIEHPDLQGLRRWLLATKDAHELYRQFGFTELRWPERFMEVLVPDIYKKK